MRPKQHHITMRGWENMTVAKQPIIFLLKTQREDEDEDEDEDGSR